MSFDLVCDRFRGSYILSLDAHAKALVNSPVSLIPDLATLLAPEIDIKVKHGVVGLLKHIAVPKDNRVVLGQEGILPKLAASEIWTDKHDSVEIVQLATIGVAKHMCNGSGKLILDCLADAQTEAYPQPSTPSYSCCRTQVSPCKPHRLPKFLPSCAVQIQ